MRRAVLFLMVVISVFAAPVSAEQVVEGFSIPIADELSTSGNGVYHGVHHDTLDYNKVEAAYSLEVLSDPGPAAQKLEKFGAGLRQLPMPVVHTRFSPARVGNWPAFVIDGATLTNDNKSARVLSVVVVTDDKIYRFTQVARYGTDHDAMVAQLGAFGLGDQKLTDYPADLRGEYRLQGAPFGVVWSGYPYIHSVNKDQAYATSYDASASGVPPAVHMRYYLRKLKPEDKRTDAEIFYSLVKESGLLGYETVEVFDKPVVEVKTRDWLSRYSFKRKDDWIVVLVRAWPPFQALPADAELTD